jgi:ribosome-associated protein
VTLRLRSGPRRDYRKPAQAAAHAADSKKAVDVVVLDIRKESDVTDYMVIAGARSSAQMGALSDAVEDALGRRGMKVLHREGRPRDRWMALDYGGMVVHLLLMEARDFYRLESLWEKAKIVKWLS